MFSEEFRGRLARGKYTRWAVDLDEDQVQALLWLVGEVGWRPLPPRERLGAAAAPSRSAAALEGLARIVRGERLGLAEALTLCRAEVYRALGRGPATPPGATGIMIGRGLKGKDPFTGA